MKELELDTRNEDMLSAAKAFNNTDGQVMEVPQQTILAPTSSAVFAEPVVLAQPMQRNQRRNVPDFLNRMKVLAQMAGEEYRYSFPVKNKDGSSKKIEGGTIKMANDLVREYGNCMVDVRVIEQGDSHVFYARFIDYETGFCMTRPFRQRKGQKVMKTDEDRQQDIVFQIGASKAIRNVVLNSLGTFADFTYEEAKNALVDKVGKNLPAWREKIATGCTKHGYDIKRIEATVAKPLGEWVATDIARVVAELKSVSDGMTTFDELFPVDLKNTVGDLNDEFINNIPPADVLKKQAEEAKKEGKPAATPAPTAASAPETGKKQKADAPTATPTASPSPTPQPTAAASSPEPTAVPKLFKGSQPASTAAQALDAVGEELYQLVVKIENTKPEERASIFMQGGGQDLWERDGKKAKTAEYLKTLGVNVAQAESGGAGE